MKKKGRERVKKEAEGVLEITPRTCSEEGGVIVLNLRRPLARPQQLKVQIGSQLASSVALLDPWTIVCLAPPCEPGVADVAVLDGKHELVRQKAAFSYRRDLK